MSAPYYEQDGITIYHGDCLAVTPHLGGADVVITDPPYGISDAPLKGNRGQTNTWHPTSEWDKAIDPAWCEAVCVAAPVVAWFGQWRKRDEVASAMRWPLRAEIVWAKNTHVGHAAPVAPRDERIWLFSERGIKGRRFETSVWDEPIIPTWTKKWHKNEKPLALMLRLVAFLTDPGETILDPFMGSGTTLRAAKDAGRRAIGIDKDESHCEAAAQRLSQTVLNLGGAA
jgi:site-specific DNA-methyltransferase (adenine-specific)